MEFIQELQRKHVSKSMSPAVVEKFDSSTLSTVADGLGFKKPESYLTLHTPKKGKDKNVECVYMVKKNKWERLNQGSEIDQKALQVKLDETLVLASALAALVVK